MHWSIYVLIQIVFRAVYASNGSVILLDNVHLQSSELAKCQDCPVATRFVTTARFVTRVTKRAAMPARFLTKEVVANRAGIVL